LPLGREALQALAAVHELPPSRWGDIALPPPATREFAAAVDGFIQYHIGISWEHGRFVRQ
jgi:DNA repair protein RecO (recombination protein O)